MQDVTALLRGTVDAIGGEGRLDRVSEALSTLVGRLTNRTSVKNALSGTWLGHAVHPALTDVPIGSWVAATTLDLIGGRRSARSARTLVGLGALAAVPTAAAGATDWSTTYGRDQRIGLVHGLANATATVLQITSWVYRRRGRRGTGAVLSLGALGLVLGSAYLGGHLSLGRGVGVDHTAFEERSDDWTDVAAAADLAEGSLTRVECGGVPVVLIRQNDHIHALSAVCTHAGGPLDEGELDASGCVTCPWHGSRFRIDDGTVQRGPAAAPEPVWQVRVESGRVLVRA